MLKLNRINLGIINNLKKFNYSTEAASKTYPNEVTIVEVGPRDGLQNEKVFLIIKKKYLN